MKSITIHQIDDDMEKKLNELAREKRMSLNKTIKYVLRRALNLDSSNNKNRKQVLQDFLGVWNKSDLEAFNNATIDFERITKEDWK